MALKKFPSLQEHLNTKRYAVVSLQREIISSAAHTRTAYLYSV